MRSRRRFLTGTGAAIAIGLAGCSGESAGTDGSDGSSGSGGTTVGDSSGNAETYEVGFGDYETTVSAANFPDKLFIYAVQTGWSNWGEIMGCG